MVGAADALDQSACPLRRAEIDDEIDIAPVDAEIERRGADHRLEPPTRHRRLDLAALLGVERAVMQRDRQVVVVEVPQRLEGEFRLHARIDEDQRQLVRADRLVDLGHRMQGRVAGDR